MQAFCYTPVRAELFHADQACFHAFQDDFRALLHIRLMALCPPLLAQDDRLEDQTGQADKCHDDLRHFSTSSRP